MSVTKTIQISSNADKKSESLTQQKISWLFVKSSSAAAAAAPALNLDRVKKQLEKVCPKKSLSNLTFRPSFVATDKP